jgi:luciferase family oxidoreductase group 1
MQLGVIDQQNPEWIPELVPHLESLGYSRFWATEQHGPHQSASPTVMATVAAGLSARMRVGTAGVLLNFYSPLKVVEDFKLLQLLFANRVELGVAGAMAPEPLKSALLDGRPLPERDSYDQKVRALVRLIRREPPAEGEPSGWNIGPRCGGVPDVWLCGTSSRSAELAAELGICYAFHDNTAHTGPGSGARLAAPKEVSGPEIVASYRKAFRPHRTMPRPRVTVVCFGICAETSEQAAALWWPNHSKDGNRRPPGFCGTPDECRRQLNDLQESYQTAELVVQSSTPNFDAFMTSYRLLARGCGLEPRR